MTPEQERAEARIDFGCYVNIEQYRYGVPNEIYRYKVIGRMRSNSYVNVPVHSVDGEMLHDELVEVIACICCGVNETKVQKFRIEDVRLVSLDREEQLIAENERMKKELFQARNERWEYEKGMSETHGLLSSATQGLEWYANEIIWIQGRYEGGVFFTVAEDDKGDQARAVLKQINQ